MRHQMLVTTVTAQLMLRQLNAPGAGMTTPRSSQLGSTALSRPKTVCSQHRVSGYELVGGKWCCVACGLPDYRHETFEETLARRERERAAGQ